MNQDQLVKLNEKLEEIYELANRPQVNSRKLIKEIAQKIIQENEELLKKLEDN